MKGIERARGITKAGLLVPALKEAVLPTGEFVGHERRHEIDGGYFLDLRLAKSRVQDGGHGRESKLPEGEIAAYSDRVSLFIRHAWYARQSWVFRRVW